jgi:type II secretory pathway component PulJ
VDALCSLVARVTQTALLLLVIGAFFHTFIKLDQDINNTTSEINQVERKIQQTDREIAGLKMDYANCTTREFIDRQIARFDLPLEELQLDQQREIRIYSNEELAYRRFNSRRGGRRVAMDRR